MLGVYPPRGNANVYRPGDVYPMIITVGHSSKSYIIRLKPKRKRLQS